MTRNEAKDRVIEAARILTRGYTFRKVEEHNLKDAIAALDSTPDSEGGWRPIETAPTDGTFVLVAMASGFVCILHYCVDNYWRPNAYDTFKDRAPTHWQPLPAPPSKEPS